MGLSCSLSASAMSACLGLCVALYECLSHYEMDKVPRGRCVIINIANFDKAPVPLLPRTGADRDVGQ